MFIQIITEDSNKAEALLKVEGVRFVTYDSPTHALMHQRFQKMIDIEVSLDHDVDNFADADLVSAAKQLIEESDGFYLDGFDEAVMNFIQDENNRDDFDEDDEEE